MKGLSLLCAGLLLIASSTGVAQQNRARVRNRAAAFPQNTLLRIIRAEDERRYDEGLIALLADKDAMVRQRAALAAGRIGDARAVPVLAEMLLTDREPEVRRVAAFALGEIESPAGAYALISVLKDTNAVARARTVEALGKIAAALASNAPAQPAQSSAPKTEDDRLDVFRAAILDVLRFEAGRLSASDRLTILLGLTAVLRAKPDGAGPVIAQFLDHSDPRIVADALNTMSRLRLKENNDKVRQLLVKHVDPIVRANAARVAGTAEDKGAYDALLDRALNDDDLRVRVSAIRSLGSLKDARAANPLLRQSESLLQLVRTGSKGALDPRNELLEIATALGRINTTEDRDQIVDFLRTLREATNSNAPEVEIALARHLPGQYWTDPAFLPFFKPHEKAPAQYRRNSSLVTWRTVSVFAQGLGEVGAQLSDPSRLSATFKPDLVETARKDTLLRLFNLMQVRDLPYKALPDLLRAYSVFKSNDLGGVLQKYLKHKDPVVRATAAELLGEMTPQEANTRALIAALPAALVDKELNDAALAILDTLGKQKTSAANDAIKTALDSSDHLLRRKAVTLLKANGVGDFSSRIGTVKSRNTESDYRRAIARIGKQVRATVETSKGAFTIEFLPADAPLTVDNFVQLARKGYFHGQTIPRVVPNFVVQAGDPRGDQNGGPGYQIRCELNEVPFERAAVGMALSGKDTGGSQWFVTHAPQPHLDGGYTVFGRVVSGMEVVDRIARGDIIRRVTVSERP
ncbi:MAG: peptidylprolyl isomerase [Pyrinomonadaceae bacterium]